MIERRSYTTAIHEAGHAVIYVALGIEVYSVQMCNGDGDGLVTAGKGSNADQIIGGFAGPWAQKLFSDEPPTNAECSEDFRKIDQMLGIASPVSSSPQMMLREELKWESRRMVITNEQNICAVANYLVNFGHIGWPEDPLCASEIIRNILDPSPAHT